MSNTAKKTEETPLDMILKATANYCKLDEQFYNILFRESAKVQLANICGWIRGLYQCEQKELAANAAKDLIEHLEYLNSYGGTTEVEHPVEGETWTPVPTYKIVLGNDGTFGGFAIGWYRFLPDLKKRRKDDEKWYDFEKRLNLLSGCDTGWEHKRREERSYSTSMGYQREQFHYAYNFNGGLIYHGPGGGQVFAVNLTPVKFWSIHT